MKIRALIRIVSVNVLAGDGNPDDESMIVLPLKVVVTLCGAGTALVLGEV